MEISNMQVLPALDLVALQEKATKAAMEGAMKSIEEYYTGYNSPFRKAINEELAKTKIDGSFPLPNILALINESLSAEIDAIANRAVAQSFVPLVSKVLAGAPKEMNFSDILKEMVRIDRDHWDDDTHVDFGDTHVTVKESQYGWLEIHIEIGKTYDFTLHKDYKSENAGVKKYTPMSLPRHNHSSSQKMTLSMGEARLEMPFTQHVLQDDFTAFMARLVISGTLITMDCSEFSEDMFPDEHECHC